MDGKRFIELVKKYFGYLVEDYGLTTAESFNPRDMSGSIGFYTPNALITFTEDRGDVYLDIGPIPNAERTYYSLGEMANFMSPERGKDVQVFGFPKLPDDEYQRISIQLNHWAPLLRRYCEPLLKGRFTQWKELEERRNMRMAQLKQKNDITEK